RQTAGLFQPIPRDRASQELLPRPMPRQASGGLREGSAGVGTVPPKTARVEGVRVFQGSAPPAYMEERDIRLGGAPTDGGTPRPPVGGVVSAASALRSPQTVSHIRRPRSSR